MAKAKKSKSKKKENNPPNTNNDVAQKVPFNWIEYLSTKDKFKAAPVPLFSNLKVTANFKNLISTSLKLEICCKNVDLPSELTSYEDCFWIANVIQVEGFYVLLRWEGYDDDDGDDFWMHICDTNIHQVGFSQSNGKYLIPPRTVLVRHPDIRMYIGARLLGSHTISKNFHEEVRNSLKSRFRVGLKCEVIDIDRVSAVRCGTVVNLKGTRLQVAYDPTIEEINYTNSIWCDERSNLIHPVGWAQLVGHELRSSKDYSESSRRKAQTGQFDEDDADFNYFPDLYEQMRSPYMPNETTKFQVGMRVEAIDALNVKTITVATVLRVLRFDYLMIGVDGQTAKDGCDAFCYHRSECLPILPTPYHVKHKIQLTPPEDYKKKKFDYNVYLKQVNAIAAPACLFKDELPEPALSFKKGQFVEAVDLMEPHLICPAFIKQVAGRLLKVSFCGWTEEYDQWMDYKSAEIYPIGYCFITDYMLQHPKNWLLENNNAPIVPQPTPKQKSSGSTQFKNRSILNSRVSLSSINKSTKRKKKVSGGKHFKKLKEFNGTRSTHCDFDTDTSSDTIEIETTRNESNQSGTFTTADEFEKLSFQSSFDNHLTSSQSSFDNPISPVRSNSISSEKASVKLSLDEEQAKQPLSSNPITWSVEDVQNFWIEKDFASYSQFFVNGGVNGDKLIKLTREDVYELIGDKLGPSLKMFTEIEELKKKYHIQ